MFNVGDLVYHTRKDISFGLGIVIKISDRTFSSTPMYAYQVHFAGKKHGFSDSIPKRWLFDEDMELVCEAKNEL